MARLENKNAFSFSNLLSCFLVLSLSLPQAHDAAEWWRK